MFQEPVHPSNNQRNTALVQTAQLKVYFFMQEPLSGEKYQTAHNSISQYSISSCDLMEMEKQLKHGIYMYI